MNRKVHRDGNESAKHFTSPNPIDSVCLSARLTFPAKHDIPALMIVYASFECYSYNRIIKHLQNNFIFNPPVIEYWNNISYKNEGLGLRNRWNCPTLVYNLPLTDLSLPDWFYGEGGRHVWVHPYKLFANALDFLRVNDCFLHFVSMKTSDFFLASSGGDLPGRHCCCVVLPQAVTASSPEQRC